MQHHQGLFMIQQPVQQSIQQPIYDSASQCSGNGVEHSWLGHGVAVAKAFAKSLIPMEDPHFSINPDKALEGIGRLATATIVPLSPILFIAKDIADAWFGSCLPGPDAKPELPQTSKATGEEAQEKEPGSKDVPLQQPSTARYQGSQGARGLLALGTLASSFHYANSDAIADCPQPIQMPIQINDTKTLGRIGRDPCYPLNGTYQQTADIVATRDFQSIGSDTDPFTGQYDGQCRTISDLPDCLVDTLKGSISHLHLTGANIINSRKVTGLAACVVDINGTVSGVRAGNARVSTWGYRTYAGIGGGEVKGTVANITAVDSTVETSGERGYAGIGGGMVHDGGVVANTTAVDSRVETSGERAYTGIGGGWVSGMVANTTAVNSKVKTNKGQLARAGIGGGLVTDGAKVANTRAVNSTVETSGEGADAGIGGGWVNRNATVANTTAVNSRVETSGKGAYAGIGGGQVTQNAKVANTTAVNSTVETSGKSGCAGIGGGAVFNQGTVNYTTAVDSTVKTSGKKAYAGIGLGQVGDRATVAHTTAVNSRVETSGDDAHAGIGVGAVFDQGTVANTTAVNSTVKTSGEDTNARIAVGGQGSGTTVANTTAVNSYVIMKKDFGPESNEQLFCQKADPRVLTDNCASGTEFPDVLDFSYGDVCPVNAAKVSTTALASTATTESTAAALAAATVSADATASTAATAIITTGTLVAAGGLGIVGYSTYLWITGYRHGLRGKELAKKPLTRGKELASAAVNSVSHCCQGIRERMNRQRVPALSSV
ncbi:hypothetical protein [Endozoicomonas sp. ALB115]|uniref:hypothetical protein n=1 Tax=Endozoicomonas sp. ALB115 TaxID=3403074 RepID=UPI003BB585D3